ncbi:hypothetical protein P154DRAFT_534096 [Amniculicola lignicola CBS 123094]|uniref:Uncharacterized protein n=1 Tax=Amniculicola lignicola CBS 123094 TaxID=1392246 RepID=A0A6A5WII3_9PLEO|nr:hypothetical protein P154DRAFT_534096 [Amniculicola lignicola CBS 123094]
MCAGDYAEQGKIFYLRWDGTAYLHCLDYPSNSRKSLHSPIIRPLRLTRQEHFLDEREGSAVAPCTDDVASIEDITNPLDGQVSDDPGLNDAFGWDESFTAVHCVQDIVNLLQQPKHKREKSWKYWTTAAAFMKRLSDGRFFVTERGYVGVGPPETKVGDRIIVFHGGAVPFLVSGGLDGIILVGEAYVHGIMYGEGLAFEGVKKGVIALI